MRCPLGRSGTPGGWRVRLSAQAAVVPIRSIGVLVGGTSVAHAITALVMPISTRLYTPHDFTVAAAFTSLLAMISVVACLRFDIAIPLPERDLEAVNLLSLSAISAIAVALLTALALAALPSTAFVALAEPQLLPLLWLLPIAVLIAGLYLALQMWYVRTQAFGVVARSRIAQSTLAAGGQISLGVLGHAPLGLIVGQMMNYGAASLTLGGRFLIRERALWRQVSLPGMAAAFRSNVRFPRYSVWEALANAASIHLPILIIVALAAGPEAGYLTLAMFLLQAPMAVIGNAAAQVYLSGAPEAYRGGSLADYTQTHLGGLLRVATPPLLFLALVSPSAFGLIFGEAWVRAGVLVTWMVPWFLMQFATSPISTALHVVGHQRSAMILQMTGLAVRVGVVVIVGFTAKSWISESYALSSFIFYGMYMAVVVRAVGLTLHDIVSAARGALRFGFLGLGAGVAALALIEWLA